jgi:hypothetical protein
MKKLSQGDPDKQKWLNLKNVIKTQILHPRNDLAEAKLDYSMAKPSSTKATYGLKDLKVGMN